jgi:hypothetical protein
MSKRTASRFAVPKQPIMALRSLSLQAGSGLKQSNIGDSFANYHCDLGSNSSPGTLQLIRAAA